jgi:hypothetical protein
MIRAAELLAQRGDYVLVASATTDAGSYSVGARGPVIDSGVSTRRHALCNDLGCETLDDPGLDGIDADEHETPPAAYWGQAQRDA